MINEFVPTYDFYYNTYGTAGTNSKTLKPFRAIAGVRTQKIFELLVPKHDRAYANVESEERMYVIR